MDSVIVAMVHRSFDLLRRVPFPAAYSKVVASGRYTLSLMILILSSGCIGPHRPPCYSCGTPEGRERGRHVVQIDLAAQSSADDREPVVRPMPARQGSARHAGERLAYHGYVDDRDR